MKLELVTVAALAASVSAIPIRIITLAGPAPHLPPFDVAHNLPPSGHRHGDGDEGVMRILPHPAHPCGKMGGGGRQSSSPFSDLFERLGLVKPSHRDHGHRYNHEYVGDHGQFMDSAVFVPDHKHPHGDGEKHDGNMLIEGWKHHVEEMFGGAKKILPIMESGEVRLLPFMNDEGEDGRHHRHGHGVHAQTQDQGRGKHLRPHGGHHWRHKASSFGSRLHRAMLHLSPTEAITLAFVLGAGIGSIMHLIFMLFLISIRRIRGGRSPRCLARQAARRERREARKAAKAAKRAAKAGGVGQVRLEGEENEEVLPSYADGEGDRLVEKA